ncbi:LysR family transcriptional regulator [Secundilactobacillus mixtipabuli]|uniref:Putative transcriptional regulator n=1 Tax=Secundilactobacillus mixtipabuli TaxID=1435342 RepID=A0A1Z5I9R4_9LACO|nr:LysR family transcriptional regulator [Secundilactobacillus mixtipabuli]GAW98523.1 putative transcriptional regulator [Secundilactobacillus mixtipabuli]
MRLTQLEYFIDIATTQNMSRSARNLHVAQPSLSRTIHALEDELATPLFTRNGRALELNSAGKKSLEVATATLGTLNTGIEDLNHYIDQTDNQVTIRIESSTTMIPGILEYLHRTVPDVSIHLIQHGLENNLLVHYDFEFSTHPVKDNENQLMLSEEIYFGVAENSPLSRAAVDNKITVSELAQNQLICTEPNPLRELVLRTLQHHGATIRPSFSTGDRATIIGMVRSGVGLCFIPQCSWPGVDLTGVRLLSFAPEPITRNIYLSMPTSSVRSSKHLTVAKAICDYMTTLK